MALLLSKMLRQHKRHHNKMITTKEVVYFAFLVNHSLDKQFSNTKDQDKD